MSTVLATGTAVSANPRQRQPRGPNTRNGCVTCKEKRVKCDEGKPACKRCTDKNIHCKGYVRNLKWMAMDEPSLDKRFAKKPRQASSTSVRSNTAPILPPTADLPEAQLVERPSDAALHTAQQPFYQCPSEILQQPSPSLEPHNETLEELLNDIKEPPLQDNDGITFYNTSIETYENWNVESPPGRESDSVNASLEEPEDVIEADYDDEVRDVLSIELKPQTSQTSSGNNCQTHNFAPTRFKLPTWMVSSLIPQHQSQLLHLYDKRTCSILTVSDGLFENDWRDVLLPLSTQSSALQHALQSLTAFHMAAQKPDLRFEGITHARQAMSHLSAAIAQPTNDSRPMIATTLVLCMAEIWDKKTTNGSAHIHGAQQLIRRQIMSGAGPRVLGSKEMRFLFNTFLYMDVISSLTNGSSPVSTALSINFLPPELVTGQSKVEIDPLLGCHLSLFPLLAQAVSIANQYRGRAFDTALDRDSLEAIREAMTVLEALKQWEPPGHDPELYTWTPNDPNCELSHIILTSKAYRIAGLSFLYDAVPVIRSREDSPPDVFVRQILDILKQIPSSSRTITVQIWPLLAAGVYAEGSDRLWVQARFQDMQKQLNLGNLDGAWDVCQECWRRQDSSVQPLVGALWLDVMQDWGWKLFLG